MAETSGGEEIPSKINTETALDYDLRLNDIGNFFKLNDDITNEILRQQLYSKEGNYLKDVVGGLLTEKLTHMVKNRTYISNINIEEYLDTNQENLIIQSFPEFKLNFKRNKLNSHSIAAAFRKCETYLVLNKLHYNKRINFGKVNDGASFIKDIGGNFNFHINNDNNYIHTCAPILNNYDQSRFTSRLYDLSIIAHNRKNLTDAQIRMIRDVQKVSRNSNHLTNTLCLKRGQNCNIKAKALMFIHSNYDIPLIDLADAMDSAEAEIAYGTFIFSPKLLIEKQGYIETLGVDFEYLDPIYSKHCNSTTYSEHYQKLRFSFRGDSSYNYTHLTRIYFSYISVNMFYSRNGNVYNLELQENRNGIQVFKILKHLVNIRTDEKLTHKIYFDLQNKIRIKFYDLDPDNLYNFTRQIYPFEKRNMATAYDLVHYSCALKEISFFADKDIVEKTVNFAIGVSENKFKPDELFNYIRSVCTRSIVANGVIRVNSDMSSIQMKALANAVYIYVYDLKYRFGKVTQQIIGDINWNRDYLDSSLFIKLFGPSRINYLIDNSNFFPSLHKCLFKAYKVDISGDDFVKTPELFRQFDQINKYSYDTYVKKKFFNDQDVHITSVEVDIPAEIDSECMVNFRLLAKQIYKDNFGLDIEIQKPFAVGDVKVYDKFIKPKDSLWLKFKNRIWHFAKDGNTGFTFDIEKGEMADYKDEEDGVSTLQNNEIITITDNEIDVIEIQDNIDKISDLRRIIKSMDNECYFETLKSFERFLDPEFKKKMNVLNRSQAKLIDILDTYMKDRKFDGILDLCASPGGFVHEFRKRNYKNINYHIFHNEKIKPVDLNEPINGTFVTGDLTDIDDYDYICDLIKKNFKNKFELITADGCIDADVENPENFNLPLITNEINIIERFLRKNGNFILKIFGLTNENMLERIVNFLAKFSEYYIYKPRDSPYLSYELYVIGINYIERNKQDIHTIREEIYKQLNLYTRLLKKNYTKFLSVFEDNIERKQKNLDNVVINNKDLDKENKEAVLEEQHCDVTIIEDQYKDEEQIKEIPIESKLDETLIQTEIENENIKTDLPIEVEIIENNENLPVINNTIQENCEDEDILEFNGCIIKKYFVDTSKFVIKNSTVTDNNCLFNSLTEHRNVDLNNFRKFLSDITDDTEVKKECSFNSMAGTMTIEIFVKHFCVGVVSVDGDMSQVILPQNNVTPMRYIYIKFKNNHYDLLKYNCDGTKLLKVCEMFSPLMSRPQLNLFLEFFDYKYVELLEYLDSTPTENVIVNSLQIYCNEHKECINNNLGKIIKKFKLLKIEYLICFIEENNFDIENFNYIVLNDKNLMYRLIDLDFEGYLIFQFRKINKSQDFVIDIHSDILNLKQHKCNKKKFKHNRNIDGNIIKFCCNNKIQIVTVQIPPKYYDKLLVFYKTDTLESEKLSVNKLEMNLKISVGCYNFNNDHLRKIKTFLKEDDIVYIQTYTVSMREVLELIKSVKVSKIYVSYSVNYDPTYYYPRFVLEQHDLDYRINCIAEVLEIWRHTTNSIKNQLDVLIKEYEINGGKSKDVSFGIIDFKNVKWKLKPNLLFDGYEKIYVGGKFLDFENFLKDNKFNVKIRDVFSEYSYGYVNKDTRLMLADKLYERGSKLEVNKVTVNRKLIIHNGAPGVGKTEFILNNHNTDVDKPIKHIVLTNTREAALDIRERAKKKFGCFSDNILKDKYRTGDSYLLNHFGNKSEVLWIDEGFMKHPGEWFLYAIIADAKEIHVMGDIAQIPYQERTGKNIHFGKYDKRLIATIKNMGVSYRCPLDIVYWLNTTNKYDFKVQGTSDRNHSVILRHISSVVDVKFGNYDHILTFTQEEKLTLIKTADSNSKQKINTIHEYQGKQCNKLAVVRLINKANPIYESMEHILVALSRHKQSLEYLTVVTTDSLSKEINKIKNFSTAVLKDVLYSGGGAIIKKEIIPDRAISIYQQPKFLQTIVMNHCSTGYIPAEYKVSFDYDFEILNIENYFVSTVNAINVLQDFIDRVQPQSSVDNNKYDHQQLHENPFLILADNFYFSEMYPYKFNSRDYLTSHLRTPIQRAIIPSIRQCLKAFAERNGSVPNLQGTIDEFQQAKILFNDFKRSYLNDYDMSNSPLTINFESIKSWLTTQPPSIRKILESFEQDFMLGNNLNRYNYILKRVAKIDTELDAHLRYKSPQTIAFLDKLVNTIFCPLWRDIKNRLIFVLKENVFVYVDQSPVEFANKLTHQFPPTTFFSKFHKFLEIDFSKYDKSQKLIALLFETMVMEYFGVEGELINIWIFLHIYTELHDYRLKFNAFINYQRKSGDAATFIGNTLFLMAVISSTFELYSLNFYAMFSGDDSLLFVSDRPANLQNKVDKLAYLYNLEAKLLTFATPYFCSKFLIPTEDQWLFVPDTVKLINKLGRNDLVDYTHVEEYRISFLDNLYYYKNVFNFEVISRALNDRYKLEGDHDIVYNSLLYLANSKKNFSKLYYLEDNDILLIDPSRPSLDI